MPKLTMKQLGVLMNELSNSKLIIQGFDQGMKPKRDRHDTLRTHHFQPIKANTFFHFIDSRTTYKLGRSWIHGNGAVNSMLHQCFKFY